MRAAQVWLGTGVGLLVCAIVAGALIGVFYTVGRNRWEEAELAYEGAFALLASLIITVVGVALLRIGKMQDKWRVRLSAAVASRTTERPVDENGAPRSRVALWLEKYAMFTLPFVTVLREGVEAIVFIAGVSFSAPAKAIPLPVAVGLVFGIVIGYIIYK